jgi:DNA repair protein RecO (recombination protein O)
VNEKQARFIILKKVKYGEADLIVQALGADGAKVSFMARSALKSKKRFGGGVLEPLHFVNFTYRETHDPTQMKTLLEAQLLNDFKEIRTDYSKLELALFMLNCVSHVSLEGDENSDFLFNLTGHSLRAVSEARHFDILKLHFCLKFLYQQGVISIESWMVDFLKTNMSESHLLAESESARGCAKEYLDSIELLVNQYIKTADTGLV